MMGIKAAAAPQEIIGAQLYTVRAHLRTSREIARTMEKIAALGYRAVQLSAIGEIEPAELAVILSANGLRAVSSHVSYRRIVDDVESLAGEQAFLGVDHLAPGSLPAAMRHPDGYRQAAAELSRAGEFLAGAGIKLAYHNHAFELEMHGEKTGLEILLSESDPRFLEMEIDTYWVAFAGGDPAAWCRRSAGRLTAVHFKDMAIKGNERVMAEVGRGNLEWPAVIAACREAGTRFYLVEQDHWPGDPFESLGVSLANLERLMEGKGA